MDLNLIKVFVAIYETRSLTMAGERLYVSQSAVSQSLSKLRTEFGDVLFERLGREMFPTSVADQAYPRFRTAMGEIQTAVTAEKTFNPLVSDRKFRLGLSELGEIGWLPEILRVVHSKAPNVRLEIHQLDNESLAQDLNRGNLDLAISPIELKAVSEFTTLKRQGYVAIMSKKNPLAGTTFGLDKYSQAPRIEVISDSGAQLLQLTHRTIPGLTPAVARIQHFATLPPMISNSSEFIAAVPETIAQNWAEKWQLELRPLPFKMSPINLRLYKRMTSDSRQALDWIYSTVASAIKSTASNFVSIGS